MAKDGWVEVPLSTPKQESGWAEVPLSTQKPSQSPFPSKWGFAFGDKHLTENHDVVARDVSPLGGGMNFGDPRWKDAEGRIASLGYKVFNEGLQKSKYWNGSHLHITRPDGKPITPEDENRIKAALGGQPTTKYTPKMLNPTVEGVKSFFSNLVNPAGQQKQPLPQKMTTEEHLKNYLWGMNKMGKNPMNVIEAVRENPALDINQKQYITREIAKQFTPEQRKKIQELQGAKPSSVGGFFGGAGKTITEATHVDPNSDLAWTMFLGLEVDPALTSLSFMVKQNPVIREVLLNVSETLSKKIPLGFKPSYQNTKEFIKNTAASKGLSAVAAEKVAEEGTPLVLKSISSESIGQAGRVIPAATQTAKQMTAEKIATPTKPIPASGEIQVSPAKEIPVKITYAKKPTPVKPMVPASGEVPVKATVAKEPWQMTKGEYHNYRTESIIKDYSQPTTEKSGYAMKQKISAMTEADKIDLRSDTTMSDLYHKEAIKQALAEGKPVPASVLKDYPELAKGVAPKAVVKEPTEIGVVKEWGTKNQYLESNPYYKQLKEMKKTKQFDAKVVEKASNWEMEQVLKDKPAYLSDNILSTTKVQKFAQKNGLAIGFMPDNTPVIAKNQELLNRVLNAKNQRELGLALGYEDLAKGVETAIPKGASKGAVQIGAMPGVQETAEALTKSYEQLTQTLTPYAVGKEGSYAASTLRENLGRMARSADQFEQATLASKKLFDKNPVKTNLDFMYKMEKGENQTTPELQQIADTLRKSLDKKRNEIQALGTGKLEEYIENYFPHIWESPDLAKRIIQQFLSKKPFAETNSFLWQRTIESIEEGIAKGLKPVSYNPIDLVMLKLREMDRYLMANKTIQQLKKSGLVKFARRYKDAPEGFVKIKDVIGDVWRLGKNGERILVGNYYAQQDAARIINNYLSTGLRGNAIYDAYRSAGNALNQAQLGLSAFHAAFTSIDTTISKFALGLMRTMRGDIKGAFKEFAEAPIAPVTNYLRGKKLLEGWLGKSNDPFVNQIADLMAIGGGRAKMDSFYATMADGALKKTIQDANYVSAALKAPFEIIRQVSKPIMENLVPMQKLGAFFDIMKMELEHNPNATAGQMRTLAQRAWDSIDNRLGQMVYDNLFWNKTFKDVSMASVRSLGWNLGTVREIGGGVFDASKALLKLASGKKGEFTYRMAYAASMPIIMGIWGAMYQYLRTGKAPQELKDYYFPQTGGLDKNGEPARISPPSYMKDVYHYSVAPIKTLTNKLHPLISMISQMLQNKDYYGTEIRHEGDPLIRQALDELKFVGTQFLPFGIRNLSRDTRKDIASKVEPFVGIVPAPYDINMTDAEKKAQEFAVANIPKGARTKEAAEKSKLKAQLRNNYVVYKDTKPILEAVKAGKISNQEGYEITQEVKSEPLERYTKNLSVSEVADIMKIANDRERKFLLPVFYKKYNNKMNDDRTSPNEKVRIEKVGQSVIQMMNKKTGQNQPGLFERLKKR